MSIAEVSTSYTNTAIIIPAYNPPAELLIVCAELLQHKFAVFVVNDGSSDTTIFTTLAGMNVTLLHHPVNLGQGAALETGICKAIEQDKQVFITLDADGQHSPACVFDLQAALLEQQADIVFGSRFLNQEFSRSVPTLKRVTLKLAALFDGLLTGVWLTDSHNGLRAFNRRTAEAIHFTENRMAHATEILWMVKKYNWFYIERPVRVQYLHKSQHPVKSIEIAIDLFLRKLIS